jgi:hypothetical protein
MKRHLLAAALALCAAAPAPARAAKVAGVEFPDTVDAGGQTLRLNGVGLRKKLFIKVYAAGLYLREPLRDAAAVVAADAPKRVRMVFLRDVSRKQVMDAYREGFEKNSGGPGLKELLAKLEQIAPAIPAELKEHAEMLVTYVPGEGTTVVSPAGKATVDGKEFADALFKNWLGASPADDDLKKGMLGR